MTTSLHQAALTYQAAGLSVIPILPAGQAGDKRPAVPWKTFITNPAGPDHINTWWGQQDYGIGIAMGAASHNLMMIELEGRAVDHLADLADLATPTGLDTLWNRVIPNGAVEQSPSGGIHIYLHIDLSDGEVLPGNEKLARTPNPDPAGTPKVLVLAETRGHGGYSVVAPTDGRFHHTGQPWQAITGTIAAAPHVTLTEYRDLCHLFASLDAMPTPQPTTPAPGRGPWDGITPGDDLEAKTSWADILQPHGWQPVITRGTETFWRRPGKQSGFSASTGHAADRDRLWVWSTSTEFDSEVPYTKLGAYAVLNHGGDMSKAAKALHEQGYGRQAEHARQVDVIDDLVEVYGPQADAGEVEASGTAAPAITPMPATVSVAVVEPAIYTRTDDGNALRYVDAYRNQIRWIPQRSTWTVWNGHRWDSDNGEATATEHAKMLARSLPDDDKADATHKKRSLSRTGLTNMLALATTHPDMWSPLPGFDANPWELNTPIGVLDLSTGEMKPPDPARLCLRSTTVPPAQGPAPIWEKFLDQTFTGDTAMVTFIQRLLGSSLIGEVREQVLPFLHGQGANGKTTLMNVVQRLVGTGQTGYSTTVPAEILLASMSQRHPTEIAELAGVRIAVASELEPGQKFAEAKVKMLTGSDQIAARFMHQDFFTFTPSHHLFLLGNHEPDVKAGGPAFWRRMLKIPFENIVPKENRDPDLEDRMVETEGPQILAWIIDGARAYLNGGLAEPNTVRVATDAYEEGQDTVRQFVDDDCVTGEASRQDLHIPVAELRRAYEKWCADNGTDPVNAKEVTQRLRAIGIRSSRGGHRGTRYYDGIRLKDSEAELDIDGPWGDLGGGVR